MKTLLAAIDFSDSSHKVLAFAEEMARGLGAGIRLFHVVEPVANYVPVGAGMDVIETAPPPLIQEDTESQRKQLDQLATRFAGAGIEVSTAVSVGLAADEIVAHAESIGASAIVMGSHGHGALYNLFAGSVVTGVLKRAEIPVVIIPIPKKEERKR